jgi:hypothetical protein
MYSKHLITMLALVALAVAGLVTPKASAAPATSTNPFYKYEVIGATGQVGLTGIGTDVSINDKGEVAFVGKLATGEGIFVGDGSSDPSNINPSWQSLSRVFDPAVQINNNRQVVARDRVSGSPPRTFIRIWDANTANANTVIARGGGTSDPYDSVLSQASINKSGQAVFSALKGGGSVLATPTASGFNEVSLATPLRPLMADDGSIIVRAGNQTTSPIRLYSYDLQSSQTIADASMGFTALGRSPGISDDGSIVAFYGDLSAVGASALGMTPGPGIFASIKQGGSWALQRVAGIAGNGQLDPGETFNDANGNGKFDSGESDSGIFTNFSADTRVGVNSTRTVAYIGFDQSGQKGIYTSRLNFFSVDLSNPQLFTVSGPPTPVVTQGTTINNLGSVQDVNIFDPLFDPREEKHNQSEVAFWMQTTSGVQAAIRAAPACPHSDYKDPTKTSYINQYNAGQALLLHKATDGKHGGNACGPSSLSMALNDIKHAKGRNQLADNQKLLGPLSMNQFEWNATGNVGADLTHTLTLRNTSHGTVTGITVTPPVNAWVSVPLNLGDLAQGTSAPFPITIAPPAGTPANTYTETLVISSNSSVISELELIIQIDASMNVSVSGKFESHQPGVYTRTVVNLPGDGLNNMFSFVRGRDYLAQLGFNFSKQDLFDATQYWRFTPAKAPTVSDMKAFIDSNLAAGRPVLVSTTYTSKSRNKPEIGSSNRWGGGHVVLFIGRTTAGDYIVKDPAGNYYAGAADKPEHYGPSFCGDSVVYPQDDVKKNLARRKADGTLYKPELKVTTKVVKGKTVTKTEVKMEASTTTNLDEATPRAALAIPVDPSVDPEVLHITGWFNGQDARPYQLWLEDAAGKRSGWLPNGDRSEELANSFAGIETLLPSDPDAEAEDITSDNSPYIVSVVNPDPELHLFVEGLQQSDFSVEIVRFTMSGEMIRQVVSGTVAEGETKEISLSGTTTPPPSNLPPTANAGGPYTVNEGGSVVVSASASDPEGGTLTYEWDLDNDGTYETPGESATFSAAHFDGPSSHTVGLQVTDSGGLSGIAQATVNVENVAPSVGAITPSTTDPVAVNTSVSISAPFSDPGTNDTHTATIDWGDGSSNAGIINAGTASGSHTYTTPGIYTVKLTVTDKDGDSGSSIYQYVVVYDPNGGFVTGGGWIDSPAGAYPADSSLTGKANFGFVSKYKKGATVPDGQTQFQFHAAGFNFHSTIYEWLVVSGPKAQYKGSGTVNGAGDYGFMLTANDGQVTGGGGIDRFRLKVWDKATGVVVYDNQLGDADDAAASDAIEGGSIVIHSSKK